MAVFARQFCFILCMFNLNVPDITRVCAISSVGTTYTDNMRTAAAADDDSEQ